MQRVSCAGVTLVATAGPGSEDTANIDQSVSSRLAIAARATCLHHLRDNRSLNRHQLGVPAAPALPQAVAARRARWWHPYPGLTASMCGSFSVVLLKIASNWIPMAFRKVFAEDRDQIDDPWGYWLAYLSFFGLCTVAPFQRNTS